MVLEFVLTYPRGRNETKEIMPTNACQRFFDYGKCGELIMTLNGDYWLFCCFGETPGPPVQADPCC